MDNKEPTQQDPDQPPGDATPSARARARFPWKTLLLTLMCLFILAFGIALAAAWRHVSAVIPTTPDVEDLRAVRDARPSILLSADGTRLATFSRGLQEQVTLDRISPHVLDALIATEDHRFYDHPGIDIRRTLSAAWHTLRGDTQGGSTITQQLVRNLFPEEVGRSRTLDRKLREIVTALKIEKSFTKPEILETYLNSVPFLYQVVGIEMAARTYFDKSAAELDLLESATLVGMLKGTSYYNPVLNPERAQKRRNVVLAQMVKHGMLESSRMDALREQPLQVSLTRQPDPLGDLAPHFASHVRRQLLQWAEENGYNLYTDGLVITSTLDDRLQEAATEAVERQAEVLQNIADVEWGQRSDRVASHTPSTYASLRKKVEPFRHFWNEHPGLLDTFVRETPEFRKAQAAGQPEQQILARLKADERFMERLRDVKTRLEAGFVAIDPRTGAVKAWVGSRDFERDQFDHVAQAERQPGSTFKPLVYGAALELGFQPERAYPDGQVEIRADDGSVWRPTDMSGFSHRMMSMREGLIFSKNTITAQVMQDVGLQQVITLARASGIQNSRLVAVPSLSLGTSPVTLLEMVSAYSTIARVGEHRKPVTVSRIADRNGQVIAEFESEPERAMSENTAVELIDMLRGVVREGTGTEVRSRFNIAADIAGKTGTTQNNTDGWFILMHPNLVAGAWVGFNDSRVTMRSDHWGQGGHNAILLVGDFFRSTLKAKLIDTKARFPQPKRKPPPLIVQAPQEWTGQPVQVPPGYGVVTRPDGSQVVIAPSARETPDELGRFLTGIGPERDAGAARSSGGGASGSGASGGAGFPFHESGN
ncbi:penicillin-binding protein 1A [Noviherbaspirillum aridicola]|uniref:Penicillin-binding protein 1A n=1 Tax=Noviherbaspirillum aridicola TaxID=2849687 RepID=A0ABQ4Q7G2_9BURK|nr:transglycosylase domain-containing protein [Noviherbaspirillum aridicola]GIZ53118.1 penicillin-binding protein 1A [Noviherbaspirillum aridicola]